MIKRTLIRTCAACVISLVTVIGTFLLYDYLDRRNCLCSVLSEESKQYPIDDKLLAVYEGADQKSGVFIRASMPCKHGVNLNLTIYPDENYYCGYVTHIERH